LAALWGVLGACQPSSGGEAEAEQTDLLSIVDGNDMRDVQDFLSSLSAVSRARYNAITNSVGVVDTGAGSCTGWFISERYVVTNQHCVNHSKELEPADAVDAWGEGVCATWTIRQNHEALVRSLAGASAYTAPSSATYRCKAIHLASQSRDFALVEIDPPLTGVTPLEIAASTPSGGRIMVIGHPDGGPKKVAFFNRAADGTTNYCHTREPSYPPGKSAADAPNPRYAAKFPYSFVHDCDTKGGSSGSPVISLDDMTVVGLHWDGWRSSKFPYYSETGQIDAESDDSNELPYFQGNVGINIEHIRAAVQASPSLPADLAALFR
jgi:V8-like Glu-specific endopeptidase